MRRFTLRVALIATLAITATACSLPTDDSAQVIAQPDLAESLQRITTTTTSVPPAQATTRDFAYFLLASGDDTEQRVIHQVVATIPDGGLLEAIAPMGVEGFKATIGADETLFNVVSEYEVVKIERDDGIATVFLLSREEVPGDRIVRDVAAQLVWTLTGEEGVEAILINIDGEPALLPTANDVPLTDQPVRIEDFPAYNREQVDQSTTTTTSSTSTTTTVPPSDG